jgi:hypothetical protein
MSHRLQTPGGGGKLLGMAGARLDRDIATTILVVGWTENLGEMGGGTGVSGASSPNTARPERE